MLRIMLLSYLDKLKTVGNCSCCSPPTGHKENHYLKNVLDVMLPLKMLQSEEISD